MNKYARDTEECWSNTNDYRHLQNLYFPINFGGYVYRISSTLLINNDLQHPLNINIINSLIKLFKSGYSQKQIDNDILNHRLLVRNLQTKRVVNVVGYGIITAQFLPFKSNYPVDREVFNSFSLVYPRLYKMCFNVKESDTNHHFFYHSIRGISECIQDMITCKYFPNKIRLTFGENLTRNQHMNGIHFLSPDDLYDQLRINNYINNSCTPDNNIVNTKFNRASFNLYVQFPEQAIVCSTDALYYNPCITDFCDSPNIHIFNVFNLKPGEYKIDDMVSYKVEMKDFVYTNDSFVSPASNDYRPPNRVVVGLRNSFIQNEKYKMPYITMKVLDGENHYQEYRHLPPMVDGIFIDIDFLNRVKERQYNGVSRLDMKVFFRTIISHDLNYVCLYFKATQVEEYREILYGDEIFLNDHDKIHINVEEGKEKFLDDLQSTDYITNEQKLKGVCIKQDEDFIIIGGEFLQLTKRVRDYKNFSEVFKTDYIINRKDVMLKVDKVYINHGVCQYRSNEITDKSIKSCTSALLRLCEQDENVKQKINACQASKIALICARIAMYMNVRATIQATLINNEREKIENDVNKQIRNEKILEKVNGSIKIAKDINEGIKQMVDEYKGNTNPILRFFTSQNKYLNIITKNQKGMTEILDKLSDLFNGRTKNNFFQQVGFILSKYFQKQVQPLKQYIWDKLFEIFFIICMLIILLDVRVFMVLFLIFSIIQIIKEGYSLVKDIKLLLRYIFCNIIYTHFSDKFWVNLLCNYARNLLILWCYGFFKLYLYIVVVLIRFTFRVPIDKDFISSIMLIFFFLLFIVSYKFVRNSMLVRGLYILLFYTLYQSIENLCVFKNVKFVIKIYRGIMFVYNMYYGDVISYVGTFLSTSRHIMPFVESKMIIESGTCTLNAVEDFINFLITLRNVKKNRTPLEQCPDIIKNKFNEKSYGKFEIISLPNKMTCDHDITKEKQFLMNFGFQINGFNITDNKPLKLHRCRINEMESLYRQVQAGIFYEEDIAKDFIKFSQKRIDKMVEEYYADNQNDRNITMDDYLQKIGPRKYEYMEGLEEYYRGDKLKMAYKMHNKDDEKQFIDFNDPKSKSRNICAQLPMGKVLLGIPCELGMRVIHKQKWCGPGNTFVERCKKFAEWISKIIGCEVICCDGSSFDSTQHKKFIEQIDGYFMNKILDHNTYLFEYFDEKDLRKYVAQSQFFIFSKYGMCYRIQGTQLSGRMNTCLCNTLRSALYIEYILSKMNILDMEELVNFEVNGDDQIIFIAGFLVKKYIKFGYQYVYADKDSNAYHGLGQICKIFDHYPDITGAEYLSCYLIYDKERNKCWLVRKPQRFFQMIPFTFRIGLGNRKYVDYMRFSLGKEIVYGAKAELHGINLYDILLNKYDKLLRNRIDDILRHTFIHRKTNKYLQAKIEKQRNERLVKCRGLQDFDDRFNQLFEQFLFDRFKITQDDILEYKICVEEQNDLDGEIIISMIDKFYPKISTSIKFEEEVEKLFSKKTYEYVPDEYSNLILPDHFIKKY